MQLSSHTGLHSRAKFIVGGILILAAVVYLVFSSTKANGEYLMTVDQLHARTTSLVGQNLPISGAVVGGTIQFNPNTHNLSLDIAIVPGDNFTLAAQGGLAKV
jgi:cytochrome c-type biogenesis protein CcmE